MAGYLGGERHHAGGLHGAVVRHEEAAATRHALEHAEQAAATAHLGVRGHLDRRAHPRQFAAFGEHAFAGIELHFEHGHGGALDMGLHGGASV